MWIKMGKVRVVFAQRIDLISDSLFQKVVTRPKKFLITIRKQLTKQCQGKVAAEKLFK